MGATDMFHVACGAFICENAPVSFLVPEALFELDLVLEGTGADDPDYRGIREKLVADVLETAIRAENISISGAPFSLAAIRSMIPPMTGQHAARAVLDAAAGCAGWVALAGRLRTDALAFDEGMTSRKDRLLAAVNRILLTAEEDARSTRKAARLLSLLPSGGRSWSRDCRIAAETDAVAQRNPKEPGPSLVTVETRGHFHTKKAAILRLTRILEIRRCGDR